MIAKEQGEEKAADASDEIIYKVDVPANRSVLFLRNLQLNPIFLVRKINAGNFSCLIHFLLSQY